jgi:hypothetical protein
MLIINQKTNEVTLLRNGMKPKLIGTIIDNSLFCKRQSDRHIMRKYYSICFNGAITKLPIDEIIVEMDGEKLYLLDMNVLVSFTELYNSKYDNNGEIQYMIPIELFTCTNKNNEILRKSLSPNQFISKCNVLWRERYKNNTQHVIF